MPGFAFGTKDADGPSPADRMFDFSGLEAAIDEAKKVLAEMALDGIPTKQDQPIWVEIFDAEFNRVAKVALQISIEIGSGRAEHS
ncbi:DUF6894 family protein [Mycoplana rhizolycopersici]|jgi:hypothetical protein|uniref:DUF6894 domain-containing protein n=1 Tax=Mycoplana rhizolycopersici TaxID=2746702 RepID=A0ABX2QKP0_9HYPH|nr:hypothetical protein [Rhizobium rhizolycopersici]NVP58355.1 hypothetical protein [Rhizobium rhizolycopersici]